MYPPTCLIALAVLAALAAPGASFAQAGGQEAGGQQADGACQAKISAAMENPFGVLAHYRLRLPTAKFAGFFSPKISGCIAVMTHGAGNEWVILDPDNRFLGAHTALFTCDSGGVNNVVLERAIKYKGRNFHNHYKSFLDDGKGGPAKRVRRSSTRYSKQACRKAFDKKLRALRGGG